MSDHQILTGPRFLTLAGTIKASNAEEAAVLGAYRFFGCDGVARVAGEPGQDGVFRTTHAAAGHALESGQWFLVRACCVQTQAGESEPA
jgi:hypothetical protein